MSYLYNDGILELSSIVSEKRGSRPYIGGDSEEQCPFCIKNTPMLEHIWLEASTQSGDCIRIVNNKYPVIGKGLGGYHDVVIDTLNHTKKIHMFDEQHWHVLFKTIHGRYKTLSKKEEIQCIQLFKNNGAKAGASIDHSHWQIIALEETPITLEKKHSKINHYFKEKGCYICLEQQKGTLGKCVWEGQYWRVVVPNAATFSYEVWLVATDHVSYFDALDEAAIEELGTMMCGLSQVYEQLLPDVHYNLCMMSGRPYQDAGYHLYLKLLPRMGQIAGFELATGCYIRNIEVEEQAKRLKKLLEDWRKHHGCH